MLDGLHVIDSTQPAGFNAHHPRLLFDDVERIDPITLTIRMTGGTMGFDYSVGGHVQTLADNIDATLLSTQKAGGFVGTVVGPYHYTPAS